MTRGSFGRAASGIALAGLVAGAGAAAWGTLVERRRFGIRWETLPILPPGSRDVVALHLSDLHMAPWQHDKQQWLRDLSLVEPDLVINTGDNLGHRTANAAVEYALEPFRGIPGVFAYGSNDFYEPRPRNPFGYFTGPSSVRHPQKPQLDTDRQTAFFESLGWLHVDNEAHAIEIRGSRFEFFGTADAHRDWDDLDSLPDSVTAMRASTNWSDAVSIGVTHAPYQRVLNAFIDLGADAIFAGHTHGGQVQVPGFGALVTNCDLPRQYVSGLNSWSHHGRTVPLEVSAGLGTSIYAPVRFSCRPEAVVVTLTARA